MSVGNVFQFIGVFMIIAGNLTWCIAGLISWIKPMKSEKVQKLYHERKADRIMSFDEWETAVNVITVEQGYKSFIIAGIGVLWVLANMVIAQLSDTRMFIDFAIYGNILIIFPGIFFMKNISKKRYGINLLGLDAITNTEVKAHEEHKALSHCWTNK